jgi:hypothetical membrane protein
MMEVQPGRQVIAGAICWVLTLEYFVAQLIAQVKWPTYSISRYDVSALGITTCGSFDDPTTGESIYACSPWHAAMNVGFVALGVLIILGVVLLRQIWPRRRLTTVALVLIALSGLGEIFAGLAPGNVNLVLHSTGALLHWICGSLGLILLGWAVWRTHRLLASLTLLCGVICLVGFFLYGNQTYLGLGRGGMERVVAYPLTIWLILLGTSLLLAASRLNRDQRSVAGFADG